jgi:hypothetical protein
VRDEQKKIENETPKIEPLRGFIEARYVKCGRSNCHCATSKGHGPYHYLIYKRGGRKFKRYIKRDELPVIAACIEERRQRTKKLIEFNREAKLRWKTWKARLREFRQLYGI